MNHRQGIILPVSPHLSISLREQLKSSELGKTVFVDPWREREVEAGIRDPITLERYPRK